MYSFIEFGVVKFIFTKNYTIFLSICRLFLIGFFYSCPRDLECARLVVFLVGIIECFHENLFRVFWQVFCLLWQLVRGIIGHDWVMIWWYLIIGHWTY